MTIFITLFLSIHKYEMSLFLLLSFSTSFLSVLNFSLEMFCTLQLDIFKDLCVCAHASAHTRVHTHVIACIPLHNTVVNGMFSLISFLMCLIFAHGKATGFCLSILYLATLLNMFISCRNLQWNLYGPLHIKSYHLQIGIILLLSFPIYISFLSFPCLLVFLL